MNSSKIFSVSELNSSIRGLLETQFPFISVAGEICNLRQPVSGHLYFTLQDEQSQIKAVLFKMQRRYLAEMPADGKMVICRGRISVYEPRGDYQLIVDAMIFQGAGIQQLELEKLKKKLAAEGLFDQERKKELPFWPKRIFLVTSPKGAAVHDFLQVAARRCPQVPISICPVSVQGDRAADEIAEALLTINSLDSEGVVVVCRGGGSTEDLRAFNSEKVARAIAGCRLPVASAVGHEIDITLADFAADLRAPTPSAAAEMILPDTAALNRQLSLLHGRLLRKMSARLQSLEEKIVLHRRRLGTMQHPLDHFQLKMDHLTAELARAVGNILQTKESRFARLQQRLQHNNPFARLKFQQQQLGDLHRRLLVAGRTRIYSCEDRLARCAGLLDAVSPLATLGRGYAIVQKNSGKGAVITDSSQVKAGDRIGITLYRGFLSCAVEETGSGRTGRGEGKK